MSKRKIELHFDGANTRWVIDTDIHDENFIMLGFEEYHDCEECNCSNRKIVTEQLLDIEDLRLLKILIDKTYEELSETHVKEHR